jgi:hypothetical protein
MRFSIERYQQRVACLEVDDLDFSAFGDQPLDEASLRCLRYMHDVELHTICYLRDVLVTDAHRDVEISTFLTFWVYEEFWHGEAIGRVLAAHGERAGSSRVAPLRQHMGRHDRLMPVYTMAANALTRHVPAIHMAWGAINEWTTQAAYGRLAARAGHPVLSELLARIKRQEGRHIDFYASQAAERLGRSPRARRLARLALDRFWTPVGAGLMPATEVAHLADHLFGGEDGARAVARIDRNVDRLPGLEGLGLLQRAVTRHATVATPVAA